MCVCVRFWCILVSVLVFLLFSHLTLEKGIRSVFTRNTRMYAYIEDRCVRIIIDECFSWEGCHLVSSNDCLHWDICCNVDVQHQELLHLSRILLQSSILVDQLMFHRGTMKKVE